MMWTTRLAAASLAVTFALAAPAYAADFTLNVNTALTVDDPLFKGLESFRDNVAKSSNGKIEIKLFPGSQLGPDEDVLEQARAGAGVAVVVDGGRLGAYVKELGILGAPYVAKDFAELRKLVTSPLFEEWVAKLRTASGHQILAFNWFQGQRHLLTNKAVTKPADLAGVRMRTPGAPVWLETVRALGATPTPMPWAEVYSALQLKAIDAVEAQHPASFGAKLYEQVKFITKTGHINLITGVVTSRIWYDKLPADLQKVLREEAVKAGDIASNGTINSLTKYEAQFREKGVTVAEIDTTPFREAAKAVYDKLGYGDLRKQVEATLAK
jgi:tripartite ATP-independent transporter DctP family solute receptor